MRRNLWEHDGFLEKLFRMLQTSDVIECDFFTLVDNVPLDCFDELLIYPAVLFCKI